MAAIILSDRSNLPRARASNMAVWSGESNACFQSSERMCRGVMVIRPFHSSPKNEQWLLGSLAGSEPVLCRSESKFYFSRESTLQHGGIYLMMVGGGGVKGARGGAGWGAKGRWKAGTNVPWRPRACARRHGARSCG